MGREYDFTERGGTGVISSDATFFQLTTAVLLTDGQRLGIEVICLPLGDTELCRDVTD